MKFKIRGVLFFLLNVLLAYLVTFVLIHFSKNWNYNVGIVILIFILLLWLGLVFYYSNKLSVWCFSKFDDFYKLRPENYNDKAREAFAKSLLDLSSALIKGVSYIILLLPMTLILKNILENENELSLNSLLMNLPWGFVILFGLTFTLSLMIRQIGLRHLHEMEEEKKEK